MWGFLYSPTFGPLHQIMSLFDTRAPFLLSQGNVFYGLMNVVTWQWAGYYMIIIYAALQGVDPALYEAAKIDGASNLKIALRIKIPIIAPSLVMTFVFSLIATLQVFAEPITLKPLSNTISSTWTPLMKVFRDAFTRNDIYSAAATSMVIALASFIVSFGFLKIVGARAFSQED